MTDKEAIRILTTDSFNDNPRRYYEALNLAVNGFIQYSKIKKIVDDFSGAPDAYMGRGNKNDLMLESFEKILDVFKEEN